MDTISIFNKSKNMTKYFILKPTQKVGYALLLFIKHKMKVKIYFLLRAISKTIELGLKTVSLFYHTLHSTLLLLFFFFKSESIDNIYFQLARSQSYV